MKCHEVRELLSEYYDDACDGATRDGIVGHLATCQACRASLDDYVQLSQKTFSRYRDAKAPPFLWTRVLSAIEEKEQRQAAPWWIQWRWMSQLAAALTVFVGLSCAYLYHESTGSFEGLLEGQPSAHDALRVATTHRTTDDGSAALVLGEMQ